MKSPSSAAGHAWRIGVRSAQMAFAALLAAFVFAREWLAARGRGPEARMRAAGRAAVALSNRLGATFIKIGQIASTRADLLPPPLIAELATLQDRVPAFPFGEVRRVIESDLGVAIDALFEQFEPEPVAAASVAQVHRARLRSTGEVVAVKVRRPDVLDKIGLDRSILLFVARTLERIVPSLRLVSLEEAVRVFCAAVEEQAHLTNEARNNQRFRANFADDPEVLFPRLHPEACSDAVLTMEFVDGVREADLEESGLDVRQIVQAGMRCVCRMIFLHGFVHADLHAGNMRFLPPGRVVLFDLGLIGSLAEDDRLAIALTLYAFATGDGRTVARLFYEGAPYKGTRDYPAFEAEMIALVESLHRRGLGQMQVSLEIGRIFDIMRRHRIQARSHMTMVNLALMTAEGLGKRLAPEMSLTDEALPYLSEALGYGDSKFQIPDSKPEL